nr:ArsR family transcriptional regulator [Natrinema gari]
MEDSGKFNYHLDKLRGVYIEEIAEGYVPTASAIALYEAVIANRPTESIPTDFDIEESCPNCGSRLRGKYEQEFLTVECPACDLFWGATYRFPKNGLAVREGEGIYKALYDRMMHHVGLARTGQCPSCAGITSVTVPRERLDEDSTPTAELTCETCSWFITVDIVSALQFEPQVTKALIELGVPLSKSSSMRATEQVLPDVTGWVSSDDPLYATISITYDDAVAEITVSDELKICSAAVE